MSEEKSSEAEIKSVVKRRKKNTVSPRKDVTVRAFCALTLDDATKRLIDRTVGIKRRRLDAFNWLSPPDWHVTIKFYGAVPEDRLADIARGLEAVAGPPITTSIRGVGAFPDLREPRVLWVGVDDTKNMLINLYRRVNGIAGEMGFTSEDRRFKPHITIARVKKGRSHPVARELTPLMGIDIADTVFKELSLMTSELGPEGPQYRVFRRIPLAGGAIL